MIQTSYFYKAGKKPNAVSIALKSPFWFKGKQYPALAPTEELLEFWRETHDEEEYAKRYIKEVLSKLDPQRVYEDLDGSILLCWENSDQFCHRHIVAMWLEKNLGIEVPEWSG